MKQQMIAIGLGLVGVAHFACSSSNGSDDDLGTGGTGVGGSVPTGGVGGSGTGGTSTGGSGGVGTGGGSSCGHVSFHLTAEAPDDTSNWCIDRCDWIQVFDPRGNAILSSGSNCESYFMTLENAWYTMPLAQLVQGSVECMAPGTYRAEMCARPGAAIELNGQNSAGMEVPGLRPQTSPPEPRRCAVTNEVPTCIEVSFEIPDTEGVVGTLGD